VLFKLMYEYVHKKISFLFLFFFFSAAAAVGGVRAFSGTVHGSGLCRACTVCMVTETGEGKIRV